MQIPDKLEKRAFNQAVEWRDPVIDPVTSTRSVWMAVLRHPFGAVGFCLLIAFCVLSLLAPGDKPGESLMRITENRPPCLSHWLGCDALGRDLASRVVRGARMSMELGLGVALLNIVIGALWGWGAAVSGRRLDAFLMRFADLLYGLPLILVVVLARSAWKPGWSSLFIAMSLFGWIPMARMTHKAFVKRYHAGAKVPASFTSMGPFRKMWFTMQGPVLVTLFMTIPEAICIEGCLSFLGIGMELPYFSLGTLASQGLLSLRYYPWQFFAPAIALIWLVVSMHLIAGALQDYFEKYEENTDLK